MKVKFTVESAQVAMPDGEHFLIQVEPSQIIEVEGFGGKIKRMSMADLADLWRRYKKAKELVRIETSQ